MVYLNIYHSKIYLIIIYIIYIYKFILNKKYDNFFFKQFIKEIRIEIIIEIKKNMDNYINWIPN